MLYKAVKGLACDPYKLSIVAGQQFDNKDIKLSKELIDRAIREKKIIPLETKAKRKPKATSKKTDSNTSPYQK